MNYKICSKKDKCINPLGPKLPATTEFFYKRKDSKDGLRADCKKCKNIQDKDYNNKNKDKKLKRDREYYHKIKNSIKYKNKRKKYYNENKKYLLKKNKKINVEWYKKNKDYQIKKTADYIKNKYNRNIEFRILCCLRSRLNCAITNGYKNTSTINLLGCTIEEFKKHLKSQFQPGMTWKNYGRKGWHIDHIKPCDSFDLSDPEQQKLCFHYTNLQPLWAEDNLSKSNKII